MSAYKSGHGAYLTMHTTTNKHVNKLYDMISGHRAAKYLSCGPIFGIIYNEHMNKSLGIDYRTAKTHARIEATKHVIIILDDISYRMFKDHTDTVINFPTFEELFPHNQYSKPLNNLTN